MTRPGSEEESCVKSRFSEEQIIAVLKESEAGVETGELCRRHGIVRACFYRWKSKFGGLELSEANLLRQLEEEHRQLKAHRGRTGGGHSRVEGGGAKK
jgi:putative transposase